MSQSYIVMTRFADAFGNTERIEYKWVGKSPFYNVSWRGMREAEHRIILDKKKEVSQIQYGPYMLKVISRDFVDGSWKCIRMDYPFWWVHVMWHHWSRSLDLAYRRLIITAAVWKLAEYNGGMIPSWKDLYITKMFMRNKQQ